MNLQKYKSYMCRCGALLAALFLTAGLAGAQLQRKILVLTSTNSPTGNAVEVFELNGTATNTLSLADTLPTGGNGGAGGNAGILQFKGDLGAVANFGSNNVSQLVRYDDFIRVGRLLSLGSRCTKPDSVALTDDQLFVVGANCAQSYAWPLGYIDGTAVSLSDPSAAQIAVGKTWAAVTMTSGSVLQLPLSHEGGPLAGTSTSITLPADANNTPLGEAFWGDVLGFTPAHSPDSFAIVNDDRDVFPVVGPTPPYPTNAPCWVAKGPKSVWYTGNSPGQAVSIFFSDAQGGEFYKSVPLPGVPTDITVSPDQKWLAVIYSGSDGAHVAVFAIDSFGDLTPFATSPAIGVASFSGVAISE
ncbi:MAG TPA: hypothetical protein VMB47_03290 [Candidatus Aquilonibacter sp.]|nr:hypothetical protein [Candidatus Aquilonibacter sp.]